MKLSVLTIHSRSACDSIVVNVFYCQIMSCLLAVWHRQPFNWWQVFKKTFAVAIIYHGRLCFSSLLLLKIRVRENLHSASAEKKTKAANRCCRTLSSSASTEFSRSNKAYVLKWLSWEKGSHNMMRGLNRLAVSSIRMLGYRTSDVD